jgi:hypothetical protein
MEEDHDPIPEPSSLEAVMTDRENRSGVAILVKAPQKAARAVRVNVTAPEDDLDRIDRFADEHLHAVRLPSPSRKAGNEDGLTRGPAGQCPQLFGAAGAGAVAQQPLSAPPPPVPI